MTNKSSVRTAKKHEPLVFPTAPPEHYSGKSRARDAKRIRMRTMYEIFGRVCAAKNIPWPSVGLSDRAYRDFLISTHPQLRHA